uniref:G protein-coupled receptor n=1 Tax=Steinernema glaseri TaxID=37863 RepID=A0A1I7ZR74_9BILA
MSQSYAVLNRILDVTAIVNIPIKIIVMVIVVRYSTPEMHSFAMLLFNGLFWNFMANFIYAFLHFSPLYPLECFRVDGLATWFADSEPFGHILFCALAFCILNCALALPATFVYRYVIFVHPMTAVKLKRQWVIAFCIVVHAVTIGVMSYRYYFWIIFSSEYPTKEGLQQKELIFCFKPHGPDKDSVIVLFLVILLLALVIAVASTTLLLFNIHRISATFDNIYLQSHRRILRTLICIMAVPILLGGIPLTLFVITVLRPDMRYVHNISAVSIVILANHGTVYAIALTAAIKPYRVGASEFFKRVFKRNVVNGLVETAIVFVKVRGIDVMRADRFRSEDNPFSNVLYDI